MLAVVVHRAGAIAGPIPIRVIQRDGIILAAAHDGRVGLIGLDAGDLDHLTVGMVGPAAFAGLRRHQFQEPFRRAHRLVLFTHFAAVTMKQNADAGKRGFALGERKLDESPLFA